MPNSNTFRSLSSLYPSGHPFLLPAAITSTTSSETQFLLANGQPATISIPLGTEILGSGTPFTTGANASIASESLRPGGNWNGENRPFFNSGSFNDRMFKLRATGLIAGGGTTLTSIAGTVSLYAVLTQAGTVTSGTKVATVASGAILGATTAHWMIDTTWLWDSTSQTLDLIGNYEARIGTLRTSTTAAQITAVTLTSLSWGLTWTFATTSTANSVAMVELSLENV